MRDSMCEGHKKCKERTQEIEKKQSYKNEGKRKERDKLAKEREKCYTIIQCK